MIKDNTVYFGYGTVVVGSRWNQMVFREIEPPLEVGTSADEPIKNGQVGFTGNREEILFKSYDEIKEFENLLQVRVNCNYPNTERFFEYKDLVFDFTNWNVDSYQVVKIHIDRIKTYLIGLIAC